MTHGRTSKSSHIAQQTMASNSIRNNPLFCFKTSGSFPSPPKGSFPVEPSAALASSHASLPPVAARHGLRRSNHVVAPRSETTPKAAAAKQKDCASSKLALLSRVMRSATGRSIIARKTNGRNSYTAVGDDGTAISLEDELPLLSDDPCFFEDDAEEGERT